MRVYEKKTEQAVRALAAVADVWQRRLDTGWQPPSGSPFPWAQVRLSLAALLPGMRAAREWVAQASAITSPPHSVVLVLAGNTPLSGWSPLCACLLAGAEKVHIKLSRDERVWMPLLVDSLHAADAELAARIHLHDFSGEDERTTALLENADAVIAYGSDAAIAALQAKTPTGASFFGYGHAISIGVLCADAPPDAAAGFAKDILMYDQQGCLSPQALLTEVSTGEAFVKQLREALARAAEELEVLPVTDPAIAHAVREARDMALFSGYETIGDDSLRWTVAHSTSPLPLPAPVMHGFIYVQPATGSETGSLRELLHPVSGIVSSAGVAGTLPPGWESVLRKAGVSRLCAPGAMQTPPLNWNNGNQDLLAKLLQSMPR